MLDNFVVPARLVTRASQYMRTLLGSEPYANSYPVVEYKHRFGDGIVRSIIVAFIDIDNTRVLRDIRVVPNDGEFRCINCEEVMPREFMSDNDMLTSGCADEVCITCVVDGYGR